MANKPMVLLILDGWGLGAKTTNNAVCLAATPNLDRLFANHPHSTLCCSGEWVGLPQGQQGNSEVGHLNLGAGRVVYQDLSRINRGIADGSFALNQAFLAVMTYCQAAGKPLHLLGLLSDGGVHSHNSHLYALLALAKAQGVKDVFVHAFMDGRDVSPTSGAGYISALQGVMDDLEYGHIATITGRYYAMDRDNRWERVEAAYQAMTAGRGVSATDPLGVCPDAYQAGVTDEFIHPTVIVDGDGHPLGAIGKEDGIIFFNFRADRAREITRAFVEPDFAKFTRADFLAPHYVAMTEYDQAFAALLQVAYPTEVLTNTLGEVLAAKGLAQLRLAETEKYAHVTFFFNGGQETTYPGEARQLVPSPQVATYDLQPEMSLAALTEAALLAVEQAKYDFILINFANPDMVGHTGILPAAIAAMEHVDQAVGRLLPAVQACGGQILITADHGNAEQMADAEGKPYTAHTSNQVPLLYIGGQAGQLTDGALQDVAPTVLALMGLPPVPEMTGKNLFRHDEGGGIS